jgi:hypothetical protein
VVVEVADGGGGAEGILTLDLDPGEGCSCRLIERRRTVVVWKEKHLLGSDGYYLDYWMRGREQRMLQPQPGLVVVVVGESVLLLA